jgi:putative ABC transport system permease protein
VHVSLAGMQAVHVDWLAGAPAGGRSMSAQDALAADLTPGSVTAVLVGLKSRSRVFSVQRWIAGYGDEALMGVLPGVALDELWDVVGGAERALLVMSGLVGAVSLAGLMATVSAGLNERRRELAVLRALGASPRKILALLALEGFSVTLIGAALGVLACIALIVGLRAWVQAQFGLTLSLRAPSVAELRILGAVLVAGSLVSLLPGYRAYRMSLTDGLSPRI